MKKETTDEKKQFHIFSDIFFLFFEQGGLRFPYYTASNKLCSHID